MHFTGRKIPMPQDTVELTGTQLQTLNTSPVALLPAVANRAYCLRSWKCVFEHAGGADFTGNTTLELVIDGVVQGEAANAISGSTSKTTIGTGGSSFATAAKNRALRIRTKGGDPTGGHAGARCIITVMHQG